MCPALKKTPSYPFPMNYAVEEISMEKALLKKRVSAEFS